MSLGEAAVILAGALIGGFVNGLTGFGTGLAALGIWLYALSPATAATLVMATSVAAQIMMLPYLWRHIDGPRAVRFVLPGLAAVPAGTAALAIAEPRLFKATIGLFLVAYSAYALTRRARAPTAWGGRPADVVVGLISGFLGGLAGLSGALLVLWTDIRGDGKDARRSLLQAFNLAILGAALLANLATGYLDRTAALAIAIALPATFAGVRLGAWLFHRLGDGDYRRIVLGLLMLSGLALTLRA